MKPPAEQGKRLYQSPAGTEVKDASMHSTNPAPAALAQSVAQRGEKE